MRIEIHESYPGELDQLTEDELAHKTHQALYAARRNIAKGKTVRHEGGVDALTTLSDQLAKRYEERLERMQTDLMNLAGVR